MIAKTAVATPETSNEKLPVLKTTNSLSYFSISRDNGEVLINVKRKYVALIK